MCSSDQRRINMHMLWAGRLITDVYPLDPRMRNYLLDRRPLPWVRLQHLTYQAPARARAEIVDRGRAGGYRWRRTRASGGICGIQGIRRRLGRAPGQFLEMQAVVDDPTSPYIDESCVVGYP